jgi:hypothetical protein
MSSAPDDGRKRPKHVELKEISINGICCIKLVSFTNCHGKDARSHNPQIIKCLHGYLKAIHQLQDLYFVE